MAVAQDISAATKALPANGLESVADLATHIRSQVPEDDDDEEEEDTHVASAQVLGNDDLLHIIFQHCPREDIQSLRLCSHLFESAASGYLFHRLTIGFRKRYVRRLYRVAAAAKFRKGVRELVWERVSYIAPQSWERVIPGMLRSCGIDTDSISPRKYHGIVSKFERFALDEVEVARNIVPVLMATVGRFRNIERAELTQWAQTGQDFWDLPTLLGDSKRGALPLHTFFETSEEAAVTNSVALLHLLASLMMSGNVIKGLALRSTSAADLGSVNRELPIWDFPFPGLMVDFRPEQLLSEKMRPAVRSLRTLHLDLALKDIMSTSIRFLNQPLADRGIRTLFKESRQLEDIFVRLYASRTVRRVVVFTCIVPLSTVFDLDEPYPALRILHLGSFWVEPAELCKMVEAHSPSLKYLTLSDINLGGTQTVQLAAPGLAGLRVPRERLHALAQKAVHEEWIAVAESCRKVPGLTGLLIESPSVGQDWTYLQLSDAEDLMEMGMGGKDNELYSNRHWSADFGW